MIFTAELHDGHVDNIVGYFRSEVNAKMCCAFMNKVQPSEYKGTWKVHKYYENTTNYLKLVEDLLYEEHRKEQLDYIRKEHV